MAGVTLLSTQARPWDSWGPPTLLGWSRACSSWTASAFRKAFLALPWIRQQGLGRPRAGALLQHALHERCAQPALLLCEVVLQGIRHHLQLKLCTDQNILAADLAPSSCQASQGWSSAARLEPQQAGAGPQLAALEGCWAHKGQNGPPGQRAGCLFRHLCMHVRRRHACLVSIGVHSVPDAKEKGARGGLAEGFAVGPGGQVEEALQGSAACLLAQLASSSGPASSLDLRNLPGDRTCQVPTNVCTAARLCPTDYFQTASME